MFHLARFVGVDVDPFMDRLRGSVGSPPPPPVDDGHSLSLSSNEVMGNTSFLQDFYSCLHSSLGYSFVLVSPMSNLGNQSLCLLSQPCNILL